MAYPRTRNALVLVKAETTEGVDASPTAGSNAVATKDPLSVTPNPNVIPANEFKGGLSAGEPIIGAVPMAAQITTNLRGSGAPATAPDIESLLLSAGMVVTPNSAAIPSTGVSAVVSGTTTSCVIDRSVETEWPSTNGALIGQVVEMTVNPSTPTRAIVLDYQVSGNNVTITFAHTFASALSNASKAKRVPGRLYVTGSPSPIPTNTVYIYRDGVLWKLVGCRSDMNLEWAAGANGTWNFALNGVFLSKTDVGVPAATFQAGAPPIWVNGVLNINKVACAASRFSLGLNNAGTYPANPNAVEGLDAYEVTARSPQGAVNPKLTLVATRDLFADLRANTKRPIAAIIGTTAGYRWSCLVPQAKFTGVGLEDEDGLLNEPVQFNAVGENSELYLYHH